MVKKIILSCSMLILSYASFAQKAANEQAIAYINTYKDLAIKEQQRSGVPASITLAQGLLETAAGTSELCLNAANHFGIKCKNTWTGETYTYTDDAKDECFRKYNAAHHSYIDHSDFLKNNKRYSSLFLLETTDYKGWAHGLKKCGYATNPAYATKLIKYIETYQLQDYTHLGLNSTSPGSNEILLASNETLTQPVAQKYIAKSEASGEVVPDNEGYDYVAPAKTKANSNQQDNQSNVTEYYTLTTRHGLKGFYAKKGDMLLEYAIKNKVRYAKLLELNDLPDAPLESDMFIYLVKKHKTSEVATHKIESGESLLQISQIEGIQLNQLMLLNHLQEDELPVVGTILELQSPAANKPQIYSKAVKVNTTNRAVVSHQSSGYVEGGKKATDNNVANGQKSRVVEIADDTEALPPTARAKAEPKVKQTEHTVATNASNTPTKSNKVNIANEPAVEDQIAVQNNRTSSASVQTKPQQSAPQNTESMSPLDRLKAHMDKTVYGNQSFEPKTSGNYSQTQTSNETYASEEEVVTRPASRNVEQQTVTRTNVTPAKQKETTKVTPKAKTTPAVHTVKRGETLFAIAGKYDVTVSQLQKLNKLGNKQIQAGMKLKLK